MIPTTTCLDSGIPMLEEVCRLRLPDRVTKADHPTACPIGCCTRRRRVVANAVIMVLWTMPTTVLPPLSPPIRKQQMSNAPNCFRLLKSPVGLHQLLQMPSAARSLGSHRCFQRGYWSLWAMHTSDGHHRGDDRSRRTTPPLQPSVRSTTQGAALLGRCVTPLSLLTQAAMGQGLWSQQQLLVE